MIIALTWLLALLCAGSSTDSCPVPDPPFPHNLQNPAEDNVLLERVFSSSHTHKGAYYHFPETRTPSEHGHVSFHFYPLDLGVCKGECGVIQRIDNAGKLLTPQVYITSNYNLLILVYKPGTGKVMTFPRKIQPYTWQKVDITLDNFSIRVCVSSIFSSVCHIFREELTYFRGGVWILGGSPHRQGVPAFFKGLSVVPDNSYLLENMKNLRSVNKKLQHFETEIELPVAELFFLCKAHEVGGIQVLSELSETDIECRNEDPIQSTHSCPSYLDAIIREMKLKRLNLEVDLVLKHLVKEINCTEDISLWVKKQLAKLPLGNLGLALEKLGKELLQEGLEKEVKIEGKEVEGCSCKAVLLLVLAGCYSSPDNLFYLAALFNSGILLPKQELLAKQLTHVAAAQGSVLANSALASDAEDCPTRFSYNGVIAEGFILDWKRAESEDLIAERARLHHGELGIQEGADDQVFEFLVMRAQQGDAEAQANVGRMFYWGQGGVQRNIVDAFDYQHAAAMQNHPDALFDTGIMMLKGHGTTKNTTKARVLLERAAKAGHKGAPGTLGFLELNENKNVTGAVHYFNQSHQLGDTDATHNLAIIQSFYKPFHPDPLYAHKMFKIAAERGHKDATMVAAEQSLIGLLNITGDCNAALKYIKMLSRQSSVVTKLMRESVKHFQAGRYEQSAFGYLILAEAGVEMAQYNLAWLCQEYGVEIVHKRADCVDHYYKLSAINGYGESQAIYGNTLWREEKFYESARWYAKAATQGFEEGLFGLGYFSKEGIAIGVVDVNGTNYYFGPDANTTKTKELWYQCFSSARDEAMLGCGVPLLLYSLHSLPLTLTLQIILPALSAIILTAFILTKCAG